MCFWDNIARGKRSSACVFGIISQEARGLLAHVTYIHDSGCISNCDCTTVATMMLNDSG